MKDEHFIYTVATIMAIFLLACVLDQIHAEIHGVPPVMSIKEASFGKPVDFR